MTSPTNPSRRSRDPEAARDDVEAVDLDATVAPVGTFAAGQSEDGRYVAVTTAPQGNFAVGEAEDHDATLPEAADTSSPATPSRAD
jgi:hypothetical protein